MKNSEKILCIIAGANGSGKSTLASVFLKEKKMEFLNADDIAKELCPEAINNVPISAGKLYFKRLNGYFKDNKSFAVSVTCAPFLNHFKATSSFTLISAGLVNGL